MTEETLDELERRKSRWKTAIVLDADLLIRDWRRGSVRSDAYEALAQSLKEYRQAEREYSEALASRLP